MSYHLLATSKLVNDNTIFINSFTHSEITHAEIIH